MHTSEFKKVDMPHVPNIYSLSSPLKKILYVLWVAKETGDGLFDTLEILSILREKYEISMDYKTIEAALREAGTKVHRHNLGHKTDFEIMKEGKDCLISNNDDSGGIVKFDTELSKQERDGNVIKIDKMQSRVSQAINSDFEKDKKAFINSIWAILPSSLKKFILFMLIIISITGAIGVFHNKFTSSINSGSQSRAVGRSNILVTEPKGNINIIQQTQTKENTREKEIDKSTNIGEVKGDYVSRDKIVYNKYEAKETTMPEKANLLTFSEIDEAVRKVPPAQRDYIKSTFKGIKVKWDGHLLSARNKSNNTVYLIISPDGSKYTPMFGAISCNVSLSDYPELGVLPEGAKIRIQGEIAEVDNLGVELINVKLFFLGKDENVSQSIFVEKQ